MTAKLAIIAIGWTGLFCQAALGLAAVGDAGKAAPVSPATLVWASAWSDGGTLGATIRKADGKKVSFCLTPSDFPRLKMKNGRPQRFAWGRSRIYVGAEHPGHKKARLLPIGDPQEAKLIELLDLALEPHRGEEATKIRKAKEKELANKNGGLPLPGGLGGVDTAFSLLTNLQVLNQTRARLAAEDRLDP